MTTLPLLLLAVSARAFALTADEFVARTTIAPGAYRAVRPVGPECGGGELQLHEDESDGSLTVSFGAETLMAGLGLRQSDVDDGGECHVIELRSGVDRGVAWTDLRQRCEGEETHVVTKLVATPRGFTHDVRTAESHSVCTYQRR